MADDRLQFILPDELFIHLAGAPRRTSHCVAATEDEAPPEMTVSTTANRINA